ncbi:MAG: hypothetical protein ABI208_02385 [Ginsengibacter sp.]|jgi:hypothetical protein
MKNLKSAILLSLFVFLLSACEKDFAFEESTGLATDKWQFRFFPNFSSGDITRAYISNTTLYIKGVSFDSSYNFQLKLNSNNGNFKIGEYKNSLNESFFTYSKNGNPIYQSTSAPKEFVVRITLITDKIILGDFYGYVKDTAQKDLSLTQGKFNANFTPAGP